MSKTTTPGASGEDVNPFSFVPSDISEHEQMSLMTFIQNIVRPVFDEEGKKWTIDDMGEFTRLILENYNLTKKNSNV